MTRVISGNVQGCVQAVACTGLPGTAVIVVGTSNGTIAAYETVGSSDPQQIGKAEAAGAVQSVSIILEPLEVAPRHLLRPSHLALHHILAVSIPWRSLILDGSCSLKGGHPLQVYAAVEDRRSGSRMVVFDVHIGESQASWERQKVVPDSVDDACTFSSRSTADVQQSKILKAAGAWQVILWPCRRSLTCALVWHRITLYI